jgi:hypothetical protein
MRALLAELRGASWWVSGGGTRAEDEEETARVASKIEELEGTFIVTFVVKADGVWRGDLYTGVRG